VVALLATAAVFAAIALLGLGLAIAFGPSGFGGDAGPGAPSTTPSVVSALIALAAAAGSPAAALLTRGLGPLAALVGVEVAATVACWALT
jgi:hypothetical protein